MMVEVHTCGAYGGYNMMVEVHTCGAYGGTI